MVDGVISVHPLCFSQTPTSIPREKVSQNNTTTFLGFKFVPKLIEGSDNVFRFQSLIRKVVMIDSIPSRLVMDQYSM
jgi:hypothetical protein